MVRVEMVLQHKWVKVINMCMEPGTLVRRMHHFPRSIVNVRKSPKTYYIFYRNLTAVMFYRFQGALNWSHMMQRFEKCLL